MVAEDDIIEISSDDFGPPHQPSTPKRPKPPRHPRPANKDTVDLGVVSITDSDSGSSSRLKVKSPNNQPQPGNGSSAPREASPSVAEAYRVTEDGVIDLVSDDEPVVQADIARDNDSAETRSQYDKTSEEPGSALLASIESCSITDGPTVEQLARSSPPPAFGFLDQPSPFPTVTGILDGSAVESENVNMSAEPDSVNMSSPKQTSPPMQPVTFDHNKTDTEPSLSITGHLPPTVQSRHSKSPDPLLAPISTNDSSGRSVDRISRGRPLNSPRKIIEPSTSTSRALESSPDPLADSLNLFPTTVNLNSPSRSAGLGEERPDSPHPPKPASEKQRLHNGLLAPKDNALSPSRSRTDPSLSIAAGSMAVTTRLENDTEEPAGSNQILSPRSDTRSQTLISRRSGDEDFADNEDSGDDGPRSYTLAASPEQQSTLQVKTSGTNVSPPIDYGFYGGINGHFKELFTRHPELKARALVSKRSSLRSGDTPILDGSQDHNYPTNVLATELGRSGNFGKVNREDSNSEPNMKMGRPTPVDHIADPNLDLDSSTMHKGSPRHGSITDSYVPGTQPSPQATIEQPPLDRKIMAAHEPEIIDLTFDSDEETDPLQEHRSVVSATGMDAVAHPESQAEGSNVHPTSSTDISLGQTVPSSRPASGPSSRRSSLQGLDFIRAMLSQRKVRHTSTRPNQKENTPESLPFEANLATEISPIVGLNKVEREDASVPLNTKDSIPQDAGDIFVNPTSQTLTQNARLDSETSLPNVAEPDEQECLDMLAASQLSDAEVGYSLVYSSNGHNSLLFSGFFGNVWFLSRDA
jgi:hypothetical protein